MLRAVAESSVVADVILRASAGAINGALVAADPTVDGVAATPAAHLLASAAARPSGAAEQIAWLSAWWQLLDQ